MIHGFVFISASTKEPLASAVVGQVLRNPTRRPPWFVVDHTIENLLGSAWPGRLCRVAVVDAATDADGAGNLRKDAGYTRAVAIELLEELPSHHLFGANGAAIVTVLDRVKTLTREDAALLASRVNDLHRHAFVVAWRRFLGREADDDDYARTLSIGLGRSPIRGGFMLLSSELSRRAKEVDGEKAHVQQDDELFLAEPWMGALDALLHAAMALGAPELVDEPLRGEMAACAHLP